MSIFTCARGTTRRSALPGDRQGSRGGKPPEEQFSAALPGETALDAPPRPQAALRSWVSPSHKLQQFLEMH